MNKLYIEVTKPKNLSDVKCKLYYMSSNSLDPRGEGYSEITNDEALEIAYKVYREFGEKL